jgi:hypothetical protein
MNLHFPQKSQPMSLPMHRGSIHRIPTIHRGTTVVCERGVLWLTQTGDPMDHFLLSGQRYTLKKRGKVLVEAMREASVSIITPGEPPFNQSRRLAQRRLS